MVFLEEKKENPLGEVLQIVIVLESSCLRHNLTTVSTNDIIGVMLNKCKDDRPVLFNLSVTAYSIANT